MAAYLSLRCKETGKLFAGSGLILVDEAMCRAAGVEPDPVNWFDNWMDTIGQTLAIWGPDGFAQCHKRWDDIYSPGEFRHVDWLEAHYENV